MLPKRRCQNLENAKPIFLTEKRDGTVGTGLTSEVGWCGSDVEDHGLLKFLRIYGDRPNVFMLNFRELIKNTMERLKMEDFNWFRMAIQDRRYKSDGSLAELPNPHRQSTPRREQ